MGPSRDRPNRHHAYQLSYIRIFRDLGVRMMGLTYDTQNYCSAGCDEKHDSGLTGFGREVMDQMALLGVVCDLSRSGPRTTADAITYASTDKPPCFANVLPAGLEGNQPRSKDNHLIQLLGSKGGLVGMGQYISPIMATGGDSIDDDVDSLDYVINLIGEDLVGISSGSTEGHEWACSYMERCGYDKGYARSLRSRWRPKTFGVQPLGMLADRPQLALAMARKGWGEEKMRMVLDDNWLRYLEKVIVEYPIHA